MMLETVNIVKEKIARSCKVSGREISELKIIAVTKNTGLDLLKEALGIGLNNFGENKALEMAEKAAILKGEITWHFIGHLQRNKVKQVVPIAGFIHSVDSIRLAEEIDREALKSGKIQKVLLEVNVSGEASKYGIRELSGLLEIASCCQNASNLELMGLMTMAPYTDDEKIIRKSFADLRKLKATLNEQGFSIKELSMGMTNDFEIAIEEGATMLRLGTALFGPRDYSKSWKEQ